MHHPDCDINDPNIEGIRKPCNCPPGWSGGPTTDTAGPVGSLGVVGGSAATVEVVEAFKRLHGAWLLASHRSDMNEQMDALAKALQLDPYTLAPLNKKAQTRSGESPSA